MDVGYGYNSLSSVTVFFFRFILQLIMDDGHSTLNIVETNPFKHLVHLSLRVVPGNDTAIKNFLSECLRDYKVSEDSSSLLVNPIHDSLAYVVPN